VHELDPEAPGESSSGPGWPAAALLLLLAACAPAPRAPPIAPPVVPAAAGGARPEGPAAGATRYRVDPARSEVRVLVYRAGPLARLGHNHVLTSHALEGRVLLAGTDGCGRGEFRLALPAASLRVDEPAARAEEGGEFAGDAGDVAGTTAHLLGSAVLDATRYPTIGITGSAERGPDGLLARLSVSVRGGRTELTVPVACRLEGGLLTVAGGFGTTHAALGLVPYRIGLGALAVREDLELRFRILAVPDR
jgi:hypothetical protein